MSTASGGGRFRFKAKIGEQEWEFTLDKSPFTLGRTTASNAVVPIQVLSAVHLQFMHIKENTWMIVDKKSTNGTAIEGQPMAPHTAYRIKSPMKLRIGKNTDIEIVIEELHPQALDRSVTKVPGDLQLSKTNGGELLNEAPQATVPAHVAAPSAPLARTAVAPAPVAPAPVASRPAPAPTRDEVATVPSMKKIEVVTPPPAAPVVAAPVENAEDAKKYRSYTEDLRRLELKISEAIQSEQRFTRQADLAKEAYDAADAKRIESAHKLAETEELFDKKHSELYELNEKVDLLRSEFEDKGKRLLEIEGDILRGEKKLASSLEEKKACDLTLVDLQRKINASIEQEKDLKRAVDVYQSEAEVFRAERETKLSLLEAAKNELQSVESEVIEKRRGLEEMIESVMRQERSLKDAIEKESEAHKEFHKSLKMLSEKENALKDVFERIDERQKELELKRQAVDKVNVQLEAVRKLQVEEEREHQVVANKLNSIKENYQLIDSQKKVAEATLESLREERAIAEATVKRLTAESTALEERVASFVQELDEKQRLEKEIAATKAEFIEWEKAEKDRILSLKNVKAVELEEWEKAEKERIRLQYSKQVEKMERDLAERRQKELQSIEEFKSKWNKERAARRPLEIREIVRSSGDILSAHLPRTLLDMEKKEALLAAFKKDIEDVVKAVLVSGEGAQVETHLKSALVQAPEATLKAKRKRKIWAAQAGTFMALIAIGVIFPQIPRSIYNAGKEVVTRNPQSADAFVERLRLARANRPKFMPKRDHDFRNTYVDNILYLENYAEIKNDDELKKAWTLALNQFFIKSRDLASDAGLELDEKVIVTFMGIESPMVKELLQMASRIQLNTQEADIQRMKDFEAMTYSRLVDAVKGEENYKKLRNFEEDFYKRYSSQLK